MTGNQSWLDLLMKLFSAQPPAPVAQHRPNQEDGRMYSLLLPGED